MGFESGTFMKHCLKRCLKRFRLAQAKNQKLTDAELSLTLNTGHYLKPEPAAIVLWMETQIGLNINEYRNNKQAARSTVGRSGEDGIPSIAGSVTWINHSDRLDMLFGHKPVRIKIDSWNDRRFGIDLPNPQYPKGSIFEGEIIQKPVHKATLLFEGVNGLKVEMETDVYRSPVHMKHDNFVDAEFRFHTFLFRGSDIGEKKLFKCDPNLPDLIASPHEVKGIRDIAMATYITLSGGGGLKISSKEYSNEIEGPLSEKIEDAPYLNTLKNIFEACDDILKIWKITGCDPQPITLKNIDYECFERFSIIVTDRSPEDFHFRMPNTGVPARFADVDNVSLLYFSRCQIEGDWFVAAGKFYAKLSYDNETIEFNLYEKQRLDVRRFQSKNLEENCQEFFELIRSSHTTDILIPFGYLKGD